MLTSEDFDFHCHSNLTRAIVPYGLAESDVHDVLNVFQVTGLNQDDKYFMSVHLWFYRLFKLRLQSPLTRPQAALACKARRLL